MLVNTLYMTILLENTLQERSALHLTIPAMQKTTEFVQMPGQIQCPVFSELDAQPFKFCNQVNSVMTADIGVKVAFFIGIRVIKFNDLSFLDPDFVLDLTNYLKVSTWECMQ